MAPTRLFTAQRRAGYRSVEPVLSRWTRRFRAWFGFPVVFRSPLDRLPFMVTALLVLFYAIAPGNQGDRYGAWLGLLKYAFSLLLVSWFVLLACTRQRINTSPLFPMAALALSVAGLCSFTYSITVQPGITTYASGLIPLILPALPLVIPTNATRADGTAVTDYLLRIIGIAAIFHVLWFLVDYASGLTEDDPGSHINGAFGYAPAYFMILSGLFRRKALLILAFGLVGLSVVLRISSTNGFIALFATAVIVLYGPRYRSLLRLACVSMASVIILANLAVFFSEDVAQMLYSIEPLMKEDVLKGGSNNPFRLDIIRAARQETIDTSILTGKFFSGDVDVHVQGWGTVPIHSEYAQMIQQGGLIGYGLLASLFVGVSLFLTKAARFAHAAGDAASEILFDAVQAINITYMLMVSGTSLLDDPNATSQYWMLILLTIFLARAQPEFSRRRRRSAARYPRP